jgi:L-cysteine:1D-myo-inositol 2-amino-2-deoxy-alpha-D-glucopyranoside ligase
MRSWAAPPFSADLVQRLGPARQVALYDEQTGRVATIDIADTARLYVCGITPYDATHMGHAATYVAFDLMVRAWRAAGHLVRYVQNVTDIDDPLLERAAATGDDWQALAERETDLFRDDMRELSVIPPDVYVGAVESIPIIVEMIKDLQKRGAVYEVEGDLYFSVTSDPAFGAVSRMDREQMTALFAERGGDPERPGKRDPLDCLVWMRQRPGEPGWDGDLGVGRPGWHVECAAIAHEHLGVPLDVQGGGKDLVFPHHEMSASEAQVAYPGQPFARGYSHAALVGLGGEKMSKSHGNLVLVSRLRDHGEDPRAIRLALLSQHYRSDWDWTDDVLAEARKRLARWSEAVAFGGPDASSTVAEVRDRLADDLDAPGALAAVDAWVDSTAPVEDGAAELLAEAIENSLGISL